ncbi:MAG: SDR family oxidoreductase [Candidatus Acidiferrales bacterium]
MAISRAWVRRSRRFTLGGKVVMITGGSRGLGLALAREFARRGSRIAVCAGNESELAKVRKEFEESGVPFTAFQCDVGNRAEIQRTVAVVEQHLGPIDVLVNNAGTMIIGPVENQDLEAFEDAMQTNFWGAVYATLAVSEGMKRRGAGRIVNIASIGGKVDSEGLRSELVKDNIFVTTACPGLMRAGNTGTMNSPASTKRTTHGLRSAIRFRAYPWMSARRPVRL